MNGPVIPYMLTCGPLVLTIAAWAKLYFARQRNWPDALALVTFGIVSANAVFAAGTFLYYEFKPPAPSLPPWQDPEILQLALLFLLAPIAMIFGVVAGVRGAPKWLIAIVEIVSLPLFLVGIFACGAV